MRYTLSDLVPGSRWIQPRSQISFEIAIGPHCVIYPCYRYTKDRGAPITEPDYEGQPVIKMICYNSYPQIIKRYLSGVDCKYINKTTKCQAYSFLYHSQPLETNV